MKILAIDTATKVASAAVIEDDTLLGHFSVNLNKPHSQKIMPLIESLLESLELIPADMDAFAVSDGPGSFTGLRIGIAAAKGLGFSLKKPVVGVCTLDALAFDLPYCKFYVCPVIDARRGQVYCGLYETENELKTIVEPCVIDVSKLCNELKNKDKKIIFTGDAIYTENKQTMIDILGNKAVFAPTHHSSCSTAAVGAIAINKLNFGYETCNLLPRYIIKSYVDQK